MITRQFPFDLGGGVRHYVDFALFLNEDVIFVEAKGRDLSAGKNKRKMVEAKEGITIHVVKSDREIEQLVRSYCG